MAKTAKKRKPSGPPKPSAYQGTILDMLVGGAWLFDFTIGRVVMAHAGDGNVKRIRRVTFDILDHNGWIKKTATRNAANGNVIASEYHISDTGGKALDGV